MEMRKKKIVSFETKDAVILMFAKKYAKSKEDHMHIEEAFKAVYRLGKQEGIDEIMNHHWIIRGISAHC